MGTRTEQVDVKLVGKDEASGPLGKAADKIKKELGALDQLKAGLGEESAFGKSLKLLQGAGVGAALGLAGRELNLLADKATVLSKEFRDGKKSAGEVGEELAKSLPIFGEVISAGRKFHELLSDEAREAARISDQEERRKGIQEFRLDQLKKERDLQQQIAEKIQATNDATNLVGRADPAKSRLDVAQQVEAGRRKADEEIRKNNERLDAEYAKKKQDAQNIAREAQEREQTTRQAMEEADAVLAARRRQLGPGGKDIYGYGDEVAAGLAQQAASEHAAADAARRSAQSEAAILANQQRTAREQFTKLTTDARLAEERRLRKGLEEIEADAKRADDARQRDRVKESQSINDELLQIELKRQDKTLAADLAAIEARRRTAQDDLKARRDRDVLEARKRGEDPRQINFDHDITGGLIDRRAAAEADQAFGQALRDKVVMPGLKQFFGGLDTFTQVFTDSPAEGLSRLRRSKLGRTLFPWQYSPDVEPLRNAAGYAGAVDLSQGGGFGRALAESLTLAQLGRDTPEARTAKAAENMDQTIADISKAIKTFTDRVGAAGRRG